MGDVFYITGIALFVMALVISFLGLRAEKFPPSRGVFAAVLALMVSLVVATGTFAVILSKDEQDKRQEEAAALAAEAEAPPPGEAPVPGEAPPAEAPPAEEPPEAPQQGPTEAKGDVLELGSPADGQLLFEPTSLTARAGPITIDYTNPSPVPHNIAVESGSETLGEGATVTDGDTSTAEVELEPGDYVFFCAVPGHRESGMEGTLTVE